MMKLNKLLAVVLVAAFAMPVLAQNAPAPAGASASAPAVKHVKHKKHHVKKHHAKKHKKHHAKKPL